MCVCTVFSLYLAGGRQSPVNALMFAVAARRSVVCWQQTAFTNDKAPLPGSRGHGLQLNLEIL